jgi:thiol-disulfide isomerase/thioredoxin
MRQLLIISFLVFCSSILCSPTLRSSDKNGKDNASTLLTGRPDSLRPGDPAPSFVLRNIAGGNPVFLRDFAGKELRRAVRNQPHQVVVLSFWATWCEPCKQEIPLLTKIAEEFKDQPVKFFLVNTFEQAKQPNFTEDSVVAVLKARNYTLPCLVDATGRVSDSYQVRGLPVLVVIDKQGIIRKISHGFEETFEETMPKLLKELVAE